MSHDKERVILALLLLTSNCVIDQFLVNATVNRTKSLMTVKTSHLVKSLCYQPSLEPCHRPIRILLYFEYPFTPHHTSI